MAFQTSAVLLDGQCTRLMSSAVAHRGASSIARPMAGPGMRLSASVRPAPAARQAVVLRAEGNGSSGATVAWASEAVVHDDTSLAREEKLQARFKAADTDGNGVIDREELHALLESTDGGLQRSMDGDVHWITDGEVDGVMRMYDPERKGFISFEAFKKMCADGILLDGKLSEYQAAFKAVDSGGNGKISATEISQLFTTLGTPLDYERLVKVMAKYDIDRSGQIDFYEFLRMFRDELLDLQEILEYLKMQPSGSKDPDKKAPVRPGAVATKGTVNPLFSEAELDSVLKQAGDGLVVLMATLTWCRPCKAFGPTYEKMANHYDNIIFLKLFGNSNDDTKALFKDRLKARVTPTFYFFKNGKQVHCHTGANKQRLEHFIREVETAPAGGMPESMYPPYQGPVGAST